MSRSVNRVILIGHLGKHPEEHNFLESDKTFIRLSLATSMKIKGEDRVQWHDIVLFKNLAKVAKEYFVKGSRLYIEGELRTNRVETDKGVRFFTNIVGKFVLILNTPHASEGYITPALPDQLINEIPAYKESDYVIAMIENENIHNDHLSSVEYGRFLEPMDYDDFDDEIPYN